MVFTLYHKGHITSPKSAVPAPPNHLVRLIFLFLRLVLLIRSPINLTSIRISMFAFCGFDYIFDKVITVTNNASEKYLVWQWGHFSGVDCRAIVTSGSKKCVMDAQRSS